MKKQMTLLLTLIAMASVSSAHATQETLIKVKYYKPTLMGTNLGITFLLPLLPVPAAVRIELYARCMRANTSRPYVELYQAGKLGDYRPYTSLYVKNVKSVGECHTITQKLNEEIYFAKASGRKQIILGVDQGGIPYLRQTQ